jgi:hypothetical protein
LITAFSKHKQKQFSSKTVQQQGSREEQIKQRVDQKKLLEL